MTDVNNRIVSGMRPTGPLHLGHYYGVLINWVEMQKNHDCFFFVADWHALTSEYAEPKKIKGFVPELVADWLAAGLDPEKCVLFQQSRIKEHAELHLMLSMITPLGWLERNPTYKEIKHELAQKDLNTYGFLGYPVLMCTDIIMYRPKYVPVGHDQLPHLELTREIARRFNHLYGDFFLEPEAKLTPQAKLPGLDGRKMSKSYGNCISLKDPLSEVKPKVMSMLTDTKRMRLKDPGEPEDCNLYPYLQLLCAPEFLHEVQEGCRKAERGCGDCKKRLVSELAEFMEPMQERRRQYTDNPKRLQEVLEEGSRKAQAEAEKSMHAIREMLNFNI